MKSLTTLSIFMILFYFKLWLVASCLAFGLFCQKLLKENQEFDREPINYPTFEQRQLIAILAAREAGQIQKAVLLERKFQLEW